MNTRSKFVIPLLVLLACILAACGPKVKFVAPEIEPPADLIPGYVPEGFELVKGYQIKPEEVEARRFSADVEDCDEDARIICGLGLSDSFFDLQSPAGNDILGLHYQNGNSLLLVTKSYYPGGSLESWRATYEAFYEDNCDCDCDCDCCSCLQIAIGVPFPLRAAEIQEVRTVGETQVAILKGPLGWITVFIRGDHLLTVESGISLEENLKIAASLLGK